MVRRLGLIIGASRVASSAPGRRGTL
ncbi:hypothetical protein KUF71_002814 [Frankliniella fusca]|uniref:Uncharacterized protein n=1 Tax=Frankliniella fusca TaxID=407009 RepID=A0AAE1LQ92_9NEOP|nr:hypothetical protein KUF71_002814 [Frankliniella fusca]